MSIIRDPDGCHVFTQCLMMDWGIRRCNVENCTERPTTIWTLPDNKGAAGLCETHYQQGLDDPDTTFHLILDNSDGIIDTLRTEKLPEATP